MHLDSCAYVMSEEYKTRGCRFVCLFRPRGKKAKNCMYTNGFFLWMDVVFLGWFVGSGPKEKNKKIVPNAFSKWLKVLLREREVLKLGLPESSFVCFFAFSGRKSNKGQYVVTYFWVVGKAVDWPTITNDLVTELFWHVWGSCKRPYDNKSVSSFLIASFLWSLQS